MRSFKCVASLLIFFFALGPALKSQDVITKVKRSVPNAVGKGTGYSEWYLLKSDPPPAGYVLYDAQFKLEGGSSCYLNAQCLEGERTQTGSVWLFRMQGRNEGSGNPVGMNEAVLTTRYTLAGVETAYMLTARTSERFSSRGEFFGCFDYADENRVPESDGPWCSLSATPPKPGFQIKSASFTLEGDRECVGNDFDREVREPEAQCRVVSRTDAQVTWQFRMLGHSEVGRPAALKSFGTLKVVYEKIP